MWMVLLVRGILGVLVALLWNLRRSDLEYLGMEMLTFLLA